ncbi:MAG: hypothetical protein KDB65_02905 [Calditrichaeota bacterium]|nr:hypothetical protein [Calditrichota bacterium]MCB9367927.1 hypothetical protein [Calditrichota bacterium]
MSKLSNVLHLAGLRSLRRAAGFTLVSQLVSVFVGASALLGGWAAFRDFQMQFRVANAERQMDQYAQTAMVEMVNILQWSLGAYPVNGGRNPSWRIAIGENIGENNGLNSTQRSGGHFPYATDNFFTANQFVFKHQTYGGFITLSHNADRGIMINNVVPDWAGTRFAQYVWRGRNTHGRDALMAYDQRDRMRMTEFSIDYPMLLDPLANFVSDPQQFKSSCIKIKIVMQYRYTANDFIGLFGDDYVRERIYETTVSPTNHGFAAHDNQFYKQFVQSGQIGL